MVNFKELKDIGFTVFNSSTSKLSIDIANQIGEVIYHEDLSSVQTLIPKIKDNERINTYSGNFGLDEFPLHTDMAHWFKPPKYILLRCIEEASSTYTSLIDFKSIINELEEDGFEIGLAHFVPRRRLNFKTNILKVSDVNGICRWDSIFLKPYNERAEVLRSLINIKLNHIIPKYQNLRQGDCLLVNNWRMLHGRSVIDSRSLNRKYERIYLSEVLDV